MTHSPNDTVREKHAEDVSELLKCYRKLSDLTHDAAERAYRSASIAEGASSRASLDKRAAEDHAWRAEHAAHEAKAAANFAEDVAKSARKALQTIMLSLLVAILAAAAIYFFTH